MENMVVLVTGHAGYIGPLMVKLLKKAGCRVVGLDSNLFEANCLFEPNDEFKPHRQIIKDIRSLDSDDLDGIDAVVHLAGLSNDPLGEINKGLTNEINYNATINLAKLSKMGGIKRFIFASSCSIYGIASADKPIDEKSKINPMTAYAKAKADCENTLAGLADDKFSPVFMRNATVYGVSPRLRLDLVVNNLLAWAHLTGAISINSDGTPWRPIVHVEDFCAASIAALSADIDKVHCQAFNVGINEENYQVIDIASKIKKFLPAAEIKILNNTHSDERSYRVDFSKIKNTLPGFNPQWNLDKGIAELFDAYKRHNLTEQDLSRDKYFRIRAIRSLMDSGKIDKDLLWRPLACARGKFQT